MTQLGPLQKKLAALAILVLLLAIAVAAVAIPVWLLNRHYDDALEDATSRAVRYSNIVGTRDALKQQAAQVKALEANRHFLKSASPALAAAELQAQAQAIFDAERDQLAQDDYDALFKRSSLKQAALDGDIEWGKVELGQSAGLVSQIQPAAQVMAQLVQELAQASSRLAGMELATPNNFDNQPL